MCEKDIRDDLDSDNLKFFMAFIEAMEEKGEILLGKVLFAVSTSFSNLNGISLLCSTSSTIPSTSIHFLGQEPPCFSQPEQ